MSDPDNVKCATHGWQPQAFVCQHIFGSLHTGIPVGFHWPSDFDGPHPDAWCSSCETDRVEAGGDWTPEVATKLSIKLICGSCYENAKSIWSQATKAAK